MRIGDWIFAAAVIGMSLLTYRCAGAAVVGTLSTPDMEMVLVDDDHPLCIKGIADGYVKTVVVVRGEPVVVDGCWRYGDEGKTIHVQMIYEGLAMPLDFPVGILKPASAL